MNSRTVSIQSDWHRRRLAKNWHECRASLSDWKKENSTQHMTRVCWCWWWLCCLHNSETTMCACWSTEGCCCAKETEDEGKYETHMKMNWNMMMITDEQKLWIAQDDICCTFERKCVCVCVSVALGANASRLNFNFLSLIVTVYHLSFYRWLSRRC